MDIPRNYSPDEPRRNDQPGAGRRLRGIVFDVDGTLYHQSYVRRWMLAKLVRHCVGNPREARPLLRSLRAYRAAQEAIRHQGAAGFDAAGEQLRLAAERARLPVELLGAWVERWFDREPLPLLRLASRRGIEKLLARATENGYRLGVVSDYPSEQKLVSLELRRYFAVLVAAQDREVGCFKPNPRGLEVALQRLELSPAEAVYVGDRPEVDAVAAQRAGMRCIILRSRGPRHGQGYLCVRSIDELSAVLSLT